MKRKTSMLPQFNIFLEASIVSEIFEIPNPLVDELFFKDTPPCFNTLITNRFPIHKAIY